MQVFLATSAIKKHKKKHEAVNFAHDSLRLIELVTYYFIEERTADSEQREKMV